MILLMVFCRGVEAQEADEAMKERGASRLARGAENEHREAAHQERKEAKKGREEIGIRMEEAYQGRESKSTLRFWLIIAVLRRKSILDWLWGSFSGKHEAIRSDRVPKTGEWFLNDDIFQGWLSRTTSALLICCGIGIAGSPRL